MTKLKLEPLKKERQQLLAQAERDLARAKELDVVVSGDDQRREDSRSEIVRVMKARLRETVASGSFNPVLYKELEKRQTRTPEEAKAFYLFWTFEVMRSTYNGIKVMGANRFMFNGKEFQGLAALQEAVTSHMDIASPEGLDSRYFRYLVDGVKEGSKSNITEESLNTLRKETLEKIVNLDASELVVDTTKIHNDDFWFVLWLDGLEEPDSEFMTNPEELVTEQGWAEGSPGL